MTEDLRKPGRKIYRALGGFLSGLALFVVGLILLTVVGDIYENHQAARLAGIQTSMPGEGADRRRARQTVVTTSDSVVRMGCRGACDDLRLAGKAVTSIRLADAMDRPLASAHRGLFGWTGDLPAPAVSRNAP